MSDTVIDAPKRGRRKGFKMPEEHRGKIKVSALLNRLQQCALGVISLPPDQVKCLEIALRKALPDLSAVEMKADVASYVARLPTPAANTEAWLESVKPPLLASTPICRQDADSANKPNEINDIAGINPPHGDAE
jgi:hypothetical protein